MELMRGKQWFDEDLNDTQRAQYLFGLMKTLDSNQMGVQQNNLRCLRLYNNQEITGLSIANYVLSSTPGNIGVARQNRLTLNVIKSGIDTLISKMAKDRIAPTFLTSRAPWSKQRQAEKLTKWMKGAFYGARVHETAPLTLRDAAIFGTGFVKVYSENGKICAERVFPDEMLVDLNDAYYGTPECMYQRRFVSKSTLLKKFAHEPEKIAIINRSKTVQGHTSFTPSELVQVVEGWRLPDSNGENGIHILATDAGSLVSEPYERQRFPFAAIRYTVQPVGFYGSSITEDLLGIQIEINRLAMHMQQSMRLLSNPRVFIEEGSSVNINQLTNEIGGIVKYRGTPPVIQTAQTVAPELFNQLNMLYNRAYEIIGVSQLAAASRNPLGANASGRALREMTDIQSDRFALTSYQYQQFHLDVAQLFIDEAKALAAQGKPVPSKAFDRKNGLESLDWNDIDLQDDEYVMQCFPASALPDQPGARIESIRELMQMGMIDPDTAQELLDFPDLDKYTGLAVAPTRIVQRLIEQMLESGVYIPPEPYLPVDKMQRMAQLYYCDAQVRGMEEDKLNLLRQFIDACGLMVAQMTQPPVPTAPAQQLLQSQLAAQPAAQQAPAGALPPGLGV
jgi:hypothetical protein